MFTKIPSVYPLFLPAIERDRLPARWLNLALIEEITRSKASGQYVIFLSSGHSKEIPNLWAKMIIEEFKRLEIARHTKGDRPNIKKRKSTPT